MNKLLCTLIVTVALVTVTAAQLRVDVSLVNVVATVTDDRGRYVLGLTEDDFIVHEDGDPQKIAHFSFSDDLPVSMGILIDTSGSMENKIATATAAVQRFIQATHADDEIFLMSFAGRPHLEQDFTSDRRKLASALRGLRTGGGTALYDALYDGIRKVRRGTLEKKALLLISDGEDSGSSRSIEDARREARRAGVLIYGLAISGPRTSVPGRFPIPGPGRSPLPFPMPFPIPPTQPGGPAPGTSSGSGTNVRVMEDLAESSGGRSWVLNTENNRTQMQRALDQIADELRNQYSIGYYPPHDLKDGKWHRIDIRTKNSRYEVRARQDYFGE